MTYTIRLSAYHGSRLVSTHRTLRGAVRAIVAGRARCAADCQCSGSVITTASGASAPAIVPATVWACDSTADRVAATLRQITADIVDDGYTRARISRLDTTLTPGSAVNGSAR